MKTHEERKFSCSQCDQKFHYVSAKRTHEKAVHGKQRVQCEICGASFSTSSNKSRHVKSKHSQHTLSTHVGFGG